MQIRIFDGKTTNFDKGGVVIMPATAQVVEQANGRYELTMTVVRDDRYHTHKRLALGSIITAAVPSKGLPIRRVETTTGIVDRWTARGTTKSETVLTIPASNFQSAVKAYQKVMAVTYQEAYDAMLPRYSKVVYSTDPVPVYKTASLIDVATSISSGSPVNCLRDEGTYIFGITTSGSAGYIKKSQLTHVGKISGDVWAIVQTGTTSAAVQPFRVTSLTYKDSKTIDVVANHVYFDAQNNEFKADEYNNAPLASVAEALNANGTITYYAGADLYINGSFYASNAVMLTSNICNTYDIQLVRDGWSCYMLDACNTQRGFVLETGKNIVKYSAQESLENMKTRLVPYVNDEEKTASAIDSNHINDYQVIYKALVQGQTVDEAVEKIRGLLDRGCDLPTLNISVQCTSGSIDGASIFDIVTIRDDPLGVQYKARVNRLEYNPVTERVTSLSLGEAQGRITRVFADVTGTWQNNIS